jgi:hypothetical protein
MRSADESGPRRRPAHRTHEDGYDCDRRDMAVFTWAVATCACGDI